VVATIHDDIPVRYASGHFGKDHISWTARYFAAQIKHSLRRADAVLAVSDFTRSRLESLQGQNPASIDVTYEGVLNLVTGHERIWPKKRQLLIMGSIHPHKRTAATVDYALRYLTENSSDLQLLVLGNIPPEVEAKLAGIDGVSRESRLLDSSELIDIMAESAALLFGSSYEGFGLPPLEAALLCTPVVYSNCAAVNEVMSGFHFPFNDDYDEFAASLDAALAATESELATAAQKLADKYSWTKIGERTLRAYRSLL
jgi:glycosyltransferase involved in cell wall biosynthesis